MITAAARGVGAGGVCGAGCRGGGGVAGACESKRLLCWLDKTLLSVRREKANRDNIIHCTDL